MPIGLPDKPKSTVPGSDTPEFTKTRKEVGFVVSTQDYIVNIQGLPTAKMYDIVTTKSGARALVSALIRDKVEALMLDSERPKPGDYLELTGEGLRLPLSYNMFGRTITPLGTPLDDRAVLPRGGDILDLDIVAPGIDAREVVNEQFYTGITMIDTLIPVGVGQRELVLCEPRSGKEQFFLDVILSQKGKGKVCIYAAVGRSTVEVRRFAEEVEKYGAKDFTIIVAATSEESAPMIIIAPSVALAIAEYHRSQGKQVLLIVDDLATHSKYAREFSLLAGRVPGRESYPADIFYQHSSLVERAGRFNDHFAGGSITLLPVIETNIENFTSLIPTNVMSQTDGHILFSASLRAQGKYPAIEADRSVTRVGRQTQKFIHKVLSDKIRLLLAEYHELERYGRFGSELSQETQQKIKRGKVAEELLQQQPLTSIAPEVQIMMLALVYTGFFDSRDVEWTRANKDKLIKILSEQDHFRQLAGGVMKMKLDELIEQLKSNLKPVEEGSK
ncbi:hypothetical protein A2Z33_04330 [Candidatus Gottesmanbacteria bacterium RBG_16_52_11]|uniref:ATPase F1/V1/A1 complex alpha/beta subunit nucleotide-binding domain-containing protein n=1 Tax=Candidatus Gottesmanbacteria bacterium RBG_16_52_11 TaxID=1798374 RepID=A0A1F5YWB4_9BACT|nr:MAG: hypothetical protein A2Z33_04330 [Candidatus Gottesmanbacteria bacterium RBG_16_52_11]